MSTLTLPSRTSFEQSEVESARRLDALIPLDTLGRSNTDIPTDQPQQQQLSDLPPVDRGRAAWMFVAAGFMLEFLFWGPQSAFGIFQAYYTSHPPFDKAPSTSIASIGTTALALEYGAGILLMRIFTRWPAQLSNMMYFGVFLWTVSMISASFCTKAWELILFQGIIPGISAAIITFPTYIWVTQWFSIRRGFATGLIVTGASLGGVALPPITTALLNHFGVPWTLRTQALGSFGAGFVSVWFLKPRLPVAKGSRERTFELGFLGKTSFVGVALATFLQSVGYFPVGVFLPTQASVLGIRNPSLILSSFNAACIPGRLLWGFASDHLHYTVLMALSASLSSIIAYLLYGYSNSLGPLLAFALLFGIIAGGYSSMWSQASRSIASSPSAHSPSSSSEAGADPQIPIIFAALYVSRGLGSVIGPILASLIYKVRVEASDNINSMGRGGWGGHGSGELVIFVGSTLAASAVAGLALGVKDVRIKQSHLRD